MKMRACTHVVHMRHNMFRSIVGRVVVGRIRNDHQLPLMGLSSSSANNQGNQGNSSGVTEDRERKITLDWARIEDNVEEMATNIAQRGMSDAADVHLALSKHKEWKTAVTAANSVRAARKAAAKNYARAMSESKHQSGKPAVTGPSKEEVVKAESDVKLAQSAMDDAGAALPNWPLEGVPIEDSDGVEIRRGYEELLGEESWKNRVSHTSIGEKNGELDLAAGAATAGSRFYYLRGEFAAAEHALTQLALSRAIGKGYELRVVPELAKRSVISATGFRPRNVGMNEEAVESNVFLVSDSALGLIATGEIPLAAEHMDSTLKKSEAPRRTVAASRCWRTEIGHAGSAVAGLYRVHQFSKVEHFVVCHESESLAEHEKLIDSAESLLVDLKLPYRLLEMPMIELGAPAARKVDLEVWIPSRKGWGEVASVSNCTDYQARRLGLRAEMESSFETGKEGGKGKGKAPLGWAHTLNGTAAAIPRLLISLVEWNYDPKAGVVVWPAVLEQYMKPLAPGAVFQ